jgi:hypothetical protein
MALTGPPSTPSRSANAPCRAAARQTDRGHAPAGRSGLPLLRPVHRCLWHWRTPAVARLGLFHDTRQETSGRWRSSAAWSRWTCAHREGACARAPPPLADHPSRRDRRGGSRPDQLPALLDAVNDFVATAFPPVRLAKALKFFIADHPGWVIRDCPDRTAPIKTKRPSPRYQTRSSNYPGTRLVTRTITLHPLKPRTP